MLNQYSKTILSYFLRFLFFLKQSTKKITFVSNPDFSDNSWHLFDYIHRNRNNYVIVWLLNSKIQKNKKKKLIEINKKNKIIFVKKKSLIGAYHFISSRIVFYTHIPYFFLQKNLGPIQVNLWHGMPIKKVGFYRHKKNINFFGDYTISTSKIYQSIMSRAFNMKKKNVLLIGQPRNDVLVDRLKIKLNQKKINKKINKRKLKLVLWVPTFRKINNGIIIDDSSKKNFMQEWPDHFLEDLNLIAKKNKTLLVIKNHPYDTLKVIKKKFSNIKFINNSYLFSLDLELHDLISVCDGLISDFSSIILDYVLMQKNLGITVNSIKYYKRGLINEVEYLNNLKHQKISNLKDFNIFFKKIKIDKKITIDSKNIFHSENTKQSSKKITEFFKI